MQRLRSGVAVLALVLLALAALAAWLLWPANVAREGEAVDPPVESAAAASAASNAVPLAAEPAPATPLPPAREAARAGHALRAVLVTAERRPLPNTAVSLRALGSLSAKFHIVSDASGALAWDDLPAGAYSPVVAGFDVLEPRSLVAGEVALPHPVQIVVQPRRWLAGRVVDAAGQPVQPVYVIVDDVSGVEVAKAPNGQDGRFRIDAPFDRRLADEVGLWVFSNGRYAMRAKLMTRWGTEDNELRVHEAACGELTLLAPDGLTRIEHYNLWIDLAPDVRRAAPWVLQGWWHGKERAPARLPELGRLAQMLRVYPLDVRYDCLVAEVPGGDACRAVTLRTAASALTRVRTAPPLVGAEVRLVWTPPGPLVSGSDAVWERAPFNPLTADRPVMVGQGKTDATGIALVAGGRIGREVLVEVLGAGGGSARVMLAAETDITVSTLSGADLAIRLSAALPAHQIGGLWRLDERGEPDPASKPRRVEFGSSELLAKVRLAVPRPLRSELERALVTRDRAALQKALAAGEFEPGVRPDIEAYLAADPLLAEVRGLRPGRYGFGTAAHGERPRSWTTVELAPGERREVLVDISAKPGPEVRLELGKPSPGMPLYYVDADTGVAQRQQLRSGNLRLIVLAADASLLLSRDTLALPAQGTVDWRPVLAPMRIVLRLRHPDGSAVVGRAVSAVPADEATAGWHGRPLGVTDARGECDLRGHLVAFKLRVADVDPLLGPFSADLRSFEQVIAVEVPAR